MAERMDRLTLKANEKYIDHLEEEFHKNLRSFAENVKKTMRADSAASALQCFQLALVFLTQAFPNVKKRGSTSDDKVDDVKKLKEDLKSLHESMQKNQQFTPSPGLASAAAPAAAPPQTLSQKKTFSAKVPSDANRPELWDLKLLPGGLVLLADIANKCVKLFTTLGQHIHSLGLSSKPFSLAVMDLASAHSWNVAVTLPYSKTISLLEVTRQQIRVNKSIPTSKQCWAIAAVDSQSLAVGCWVVRGIDLMDLQGNILRQLSSDVEPRWMDVSDQCLVMSTTADTLVKLRLADKSVCFNKEVPQIPNPRGVACLQDGSSLVTDRVSRSVHLVSPDGGTVRQLWRCPGGRATEGWLSSVSVFNSVCACSTRWGSVFVLDVS